jgi:hypothetical protein
MRYSMDLKLILDKKEIFIEFDGPSHFVISQYGPPKRHPFKKRDSVQEKTGIEVINWAYWIQRCSANVRALFDKNINGYGALWSTVMHFGMFFFDDSAQIIETISKRFNAVDENGYGYFYGPNTKNRNNPKHPIIKKKKNGDVNLDAILPKNYKERNYWIPDELKQI